jgi:hypothetical protein
MLPDIFALTRFNNKQFMNANIPAKIAVVNLNLTVFFISPLSFSID